MSSAPTLRPLAAVLDELLASLPVLAPRTVPIAEAVGSVLAEPLLAAAPVPPASTALRAGAAVASADLIGASPYSPVPLLAGPLMVRPGEPLPPGTDAVLPEDCLVASGSLVETVASVAPGENALRTGEDARAGQSIRAAGEVLRPLDLAMATAAGLQLASVRRARIALVGGAVPFVLAAPAGAEIVPTPIGDADLAIVVAQDPNSVRFDRMVAHGMAIRPGDTAQVGFAGNRLVILCPPRLDALLALTRCLLAPLVRHLTGQRPPVPWRRAPLTRKVVSTVGLAEVALLRVTDGGLEPLAIGALPFAALAGADAFMLVPPESEGFGAGETVAVEALEF